MTRSKKSRQKLDVTFEQLNALIGRVPRRVNSNDERMSIIETTARLLGDASVRIKEFVRTRPTWQRQASLGRARCLFGLDRPDSSLMQPRLEWKMSLSERIATETLARLLNAGGVQARARRIEAFLRALSPDIVSGCLASADVFSEVPAMDGRRIDLKFLWRDAQDRDRVLVVEAKFDHIVTDGQLSCYRVSTKNDHPRADRHYLILALDQNAMQRVNRRDDGNWLFCSWRDLWLRFETTRPPEDDLNLRLFLHALWHRIGRLNPKDAHALL